MSLRCLLRVLSRVKLVATRCVRMMRGLLVLPSFVMFSRFAVMLGCVRVMF